MLCRKHQNHVVQEVGSNSQAMSYGRQAAGGGNAARYLSCSKQQLAASAVRVGREWSRPHAGAPACGLHLSLIYHCMISVTSDVLISITKYNGH